MIQFICLEALDYLIQTKNATSVPIDPIIRKLDCNFFSGRRELLPDRQRDLLYCVAQINVEDAEFSIPDIEAVSKKTGRPIKPFKRGDISRMLPRLIESGLIYRNRIGKYCFAVPQFGRFVNRNYESSGLQRSLFE